jgi:hypothetical protein
MNLKEFRAQYPQYDDLSDDQLATGLHQRFYSDLPKEDFFKQIGYAVEGKTSNPLKGALGRGADLLSSGIEAVKRSTQELGKRMEGALTEEEKAGMADLRSKVPSVVKPEDEKKIFGTLEDWTNSLRGYSKSIGYEPSVKLGDLGDNPLKVVPFVAERIITSSPDMAAAVANAPAYVYARTDEILNERLKNDQKDLKDATVGDLTTALGAAIFETTLERFATRGLLKGQGAPGKTAAGRIGKETAIQSGTEGVEEGVAYIAGTAGTKKGVDYKELAENVAEGMIVGGGLGTSVQTGKEIFRPKEKAAEDTTVRQEFTTDAQGNLVPKTEAAPATAPAPITGATQPELFTQEQAPYAVTQGETTAEQRQQAEVERQIDALLQQEQTPEVQAQIEQLRSQLPEAPKDRATALGEEMMTLERKYKELETTRNATKGLKEKGALTEQMKTIRARQTEILAEGKQLQKQGVSFAAPEEQAAFDFEAPPVIDEEVTKKFGFTPKATKIVEAIQGLDMTKPEDRQTFRNEIAKHERKGAKVDVQAAEDYVANFEEAPSGPRAIPGASQPSIPVPSEEVTPTGGLEAPVTGRLEPTVGPTAGPVGGAEISGEGGAAALEAAPPVETPPVETLPVETPPVETPPPATAEEAIQQAEAPPAPTPSGIQYPTGEPTQAPRRTRADNRVADFLASLSEAELATLEAYYGLKQDSAEFFNRVKQDVATYINKGANAIAKAIRDIIQKIANGMLSVAVVFNSSALQPTTFNVPQSFNETRAVSIEAPANLPMSDVSKRAYSLSAPAFIKAKQAFFIADKPNGVVYMFDNKGQFITASDALYGEQAGDVLTEESRNKPIEKMTTVDKVTPAGTFNVSFSKDPSYTGGYILRFADEKGDLGGISMHSVYLGNVNENRLQRLASSNLADKKVSLGCVNTSPEFMLEEVLPRAGELFEGGKKAGVVVIPDQQEQLGAYLKPLEVKAPAKEAKATARADMVGKEEQLPTEEKAPLQREEVLGKKTETLTKNVADGNTQAALKEIATSKQFSPLDNLLAQGLLDTNKTLPKIEVVAPAKIDEDAAGQYDPNIDTAQIAEGQVDSHTVLHEVSHGSMHAMIVADENQVARGLPANPVLNDIKDVYQHVLRVRKDLVASGKYGIKNLTEFVSEMWSNPEFQLEMKNTPYKRITVYKEFGRKVVKLLTGIDLEAGKVSAVDADALVAGLLAIEKAMPLGRRVQEAGKVQAPVAAVQRTPEGQKNEQLFKAAGGGKFPPPQPKFKRKLQEWKTAYNNNMLIPTLLGKGQNLFSFDRAYSNRMRNALLNLAKQGNITMQQAKLALLRISISQALYRSDIARRFMSSGKIGYNAAENRWYTEKDPINMEALKDQVRAYAKRTGADNDQALQEIGQAYIAYRMEGFYKDLDNTKAEVTRTEKKIQAKIDVDKNKKLLKELKAKEQSLIDKVKGVTRQEMQAGMQLYNSNPEIKKGTDIWNTMRERAIKALVESGVKNEEQAQEWLDEAAYVPFFRNMGENEQSGPLVMTRGLREVMGDPRMKGSDKEITNPIENMHQWMQWSIARAISNKQLNAMLAQYKAVLPNEVKEGKGDPANTFSVYQDGKQKFYQVADPAIAQGFSGMETVIFPGIGAAMRFKNGFSHIITRIPIFPVAQLILMDTWAAMYTSGVKHPFALLKEIPKEMVKTAMGTSEARKVMTSAGVLSTHEYNALTDADDLTVKLQLDKPGVYTRTMNMLDKWAALNDNMLRQAVYAQRRKEGASQAEAMEAGVEIVNFRRMSGNPIMRFASSITPFFNAATQVLDVAGKTVTGKGITPQERKEGLAVLAATAAKLTAISFVYAAAVSDDEDYQKKNRMVRDRVFVIPGSGGFSIPLREDIFLIPKIAGEYSYNLMMDKAFVDSKMAKDAMARAVKKQFSPPSTNLVSPILDVLQNYDSFHDRDIVNPTLSKLDPELQYTKSTSELSKVLGKAGGISPAKLDYALNGYFGSVMSLLALATNDMIAQARGVPRPERTTKEIVASLPSMGGFVSKQESVNAIGDFYEAARDVNKTVNTYRELSKRDRAEGDKYIKEPERTKQAEQYKGVQKIEDFLAKINREETRIMESKDMTSAEKRRELDKLLVERQKFTKPVRELRQNLGF